MGLTTALPPCAMGSQWTVDSDSPAQRSISARHNIAMSRILVFSLLVALALSGPLTSLHSPEVSLSLNPGHPITGANSAVHVVKRSPEEGEDGEPEPEPESEPEPEADRR